MPVKELWQLHCLKGGARDLVAQRDCELSRKGSRETKEWIVAQRERWLDLYPEMAGCAWEMVREDNPKFFMAAAE